MSANDNDTAPTAVLSWTSKNAEGRVLGNEEYHVTVAEHAEYECNMKLTWTSSGGLSGTTNPLSFRNLFVRNETTTAMYTAGAGGTFSFDICLLGTAGVIKHKIISGHPDDDVVKRATDAYDAVVSGWLKDA